MRTGEELITYTKWKGLFVTKKSFLFAFIRRSKNFLISGVSLIYSFTWLPTMLCITGWLLPIAFWEDKGKVEEELKISIVISTSTKIKFPFFDKGFVISRHTMSRTG